MNAPTVTDWATKVHAAHVRLGVRMTGNCEACRKDDRPEWVKRAAESRLPVKDYTRAT